MNPRCVQFYFSNILGPVHNEKQPTLLFIRMASSLCNINTMVPPTKPLPLIPTMQTTTSNNSTFLLIILISFLELTVQTASTLIEAPTDLEVSSTPTNSNFIL